jgi:hypothetical protein
MTMQTDGHRGHVLGMVAVGAAVLLVLLAAGRSVGEAIPLAAALACPLMLIGMVFVMGRGSRGDSVHHVAGRPHEAPGSAVDRHGLPLPVGLASSDGQLDGEDRTMTGPGTVGRDGSPVRPGDGPHDG